MEERSSISRCYASGEGCHGSADRRSSRPSALRLGRGPPSPASLAIESGSASRRDTTGEGSWGGGASGEWVVGDGSNASACPSGRPRANGPESWLDPALGPELESGKPPDTCGPSSMRRPSPARVSTMGEGRVSLCMAGGWRSGGGTTRAAAATLATVTGEGRKARKRAAPRAAGWPSRAGTKSGRPGVAVIPINDGGTCTTVVSHRQDTAA